MCVCVCVCVCLYVCVCERERERERFQNKTGGIMESLSLRLMRTVYWLTF